MEQASPIVLVIDADAASRNYLSVILRKAGYAVILVASAREGLVSAWKDTPNVVIFDPVLPDMMAIELLTRLRQDRRTAQTPCLALSSREDSREISALLSAGCNEYLVKSGQAMAKVLELLPGLLRGETLVQKGGFLIVFLSAKGGTGTSSLCANIAMCMGKSNPKASVVVLDFVLPIGSIANIVGYDEKMNLVSVAQQDPGQTTAQYFRENLPKRQVWYFSLLAGSLDPESANQLAVGRLPDIIHLIRDAYDYVFVDLGRALSRISLPIIQRADVLALVLSTDYAAVTLTQTVWEYLRVQGVDPQRVYAILNRAVGLEGLTKVEAEQMLGLPIRATMPYMGGNFALANNRHEPVVSKFPNDSASIMLKQASEEMAALGLRLRSREPHS